MKSCPTYYANICVGLRPAYNQHITNTELNGMRKHAFNLCQNYCDEVGLGLTFTETNYIYTDGNEPGLIIGLINYPRFPKDKQDIHNNSQELGKILLKELEQERLSIIYPDVTIMIEKHDL